jgi:alpha-mannosidase
MTETLHIVSHTHWDREWYLPFQQFRLRLVDLIDHLLDLLERDADFRSFHLDAQTIVLEDYLEIRSYNRARLERAIRDGRIIVGPWYQLNDEFLTSGEATVRSLLVGTRIARQFGACPAIGYLPDQFGNLSQMPQIFNGFGIDNAVFGRGYQLVDDRKMEFLWASPDGSQVTASLMAFWYNNAQHIPADPQAALAYLNGLVEKMAGQSAVSHLLLMNGVDHLEPQQDLSTALNGVRPLLPPEVQVVHSSIPEYVAAVQAEVQAKGIALQRYTGELREDRGSACLAGTLSSRIYLKQANQHAQITLEKYAEPFAAFAQLEGAPYPYDFLNYAWKLLMKNHPHDSICGCSIDAVHSEMLPRFAQVEQIGGELTQRALQTLADRVTVAPHPADGETGLVVFNPLNWPRTDPVRATLAFPLGAPTRGNAPRDDRRQVRGIRLSDAEGRDVPFTVTATQVKIRSVLSPVELPLDQWVQEMDIEFIAEDVPACGYKAYRVTPCDATPQYTPWNAAAASGWQAALEDSGDVGDEYLYRKPAQDQRLEHALLTTHPVEEHTALRQTRTEPFVWDLPAAATADGAARSEDGAACAVTTQVTRWRGIPRVEFTTTIDNRARDHRLRVVFQPQGDFQPETYSIAEGQFDTLFRPLVQAHEAEGAAPFYPQQNWVALMGRSAAGDALQTVAVLNQGLPEYEIYNRPGGPGIAVTLLRCVNVLSGGADCYRIETPDAQCQGEHTFRYALLEVSGDWKAAQVWKQAAQFNAPLQAVQTDPHAGNRTLPPELSFVTLEPDTLMISAIKRAEDDPRQIIVRFYNPSDEAVSGGRIRVRHTSSAARVNLNEEQPQPLPLEPDGSVRLPEVGAKKIVTLAFGMEHR